MSLSRDEWIITLGQDIMDQLPPERLGPGESAAFTDNARRWLAGTQREPRSRADSLGFGVDAVQAGATVMALMAAQAAWTVVAKAATDSGADGLRSLVARLARWLGSRLRRTPGKHEAPRQRLPAPGEDAEPLSPSQLAAVRKAVSRLLIRAGIPRETAELVADALIGVLAGPAGIPSR